MYIFVLKLENNKFYIGNTYNPYFSLETYKNVDNDKNLFTLNNKPISVYAFFPKCDEFDEDKIVKKYMDEYGIDNVRGGSYNTLNLDDNVHYFIKRELWYINNKCTICGGHHFTNDCENEKKIQNQIQDKIHNNNNKRNKCYFCFKFF